MGGDPFEYVEPARVPSPCISICSLDPVTGWCEGCGRSGDEIAAWPYATDEWRAALLREIDERRRPGSNNA